MQKANRPERGKGRMVVSTGNDTTKLRMLICMTLMMWEEEEALTIAMMTLLLPHPHLPLPLITQLKQQQLH
jgi:hypothetical protein